MIKFGSKRHLRKPDTPQRAKWREYNQRRYRERVQENQSIAELALREVEPIDLPDVCKRCLIVCDIVSRECRIKPRDLYRLRPDLILMPPERAGLLRGDTAIEGLAV